MPYNFTIIEKKWQQYWLEHKSFRALDPKEAGNMPKAYVLDMFPYPSGAGLHVGHPEGYTATDIYSRYLRMRGYNVLHPMGWDAFGLPAEQYAIKTGQHPRVTTEQNIANFRRQIQMLGLSYDWDREVDTTDQKYYKWTQWIFLQLFNSYFDPVQKKAMPIGHLVNELQNENYLIAPDGSIHLNPTIEGMEAIGGQVATAMRQWKTLSAEEQRDILDSQRLAYTDEVAVNWCAGLGTVLANEEVIDGKSEVGGFPVERRPMRQWMLRITAYADRLVDDLNLLEWPESLKEMQRNWIGRSLGAEVDFEVAGMSDGGDDDVITVFTTRPDTLYGATYMVLAPEHPLVEKLTTDAQRAEVQAYRQAVANKSERDRMEGAKDKTGVFTGSYAINPVNDEKIPIWIADYVLMGYGTGAIMAVPAHDERDYDFARKFRLPIRAVVAIGESHTQPKPVLRLREPFQTLGIPREWTQNYGMVLEGHSQQTEPYVHWYMFADEQGLERFVKDNEISDYKTASAFPYNFHLPYIGDGISVNSGPLNDLPTPKAKEMIIDILEGEGTGKGSVKYKLRDWLFSRQRYWGEPFPIVLDEQGNAYDIPVSELPLLLPEVQDFKPTGTPEPPLSKVKEWLKYDASGLVASATMSKSFTRETNTMPQWAGSCWYYLRYIDPHNPDRFVDPEKEKYWMPVDLYVGGVEHAVLHLLYARFWHKVLFDLGHVISPEPFKRLVNQGLILGEMEYHFFENAAKQMVSATELQGIDEEATEQGVKMFGFHKTTREKIFGTRVEEILVEKKGDGYVLKANPNIRVDARSFKMSKSRGNVVNPDRIVEDYGADCFRLYEMYMGPLEAQKPWNTRDIVGMSRFLNGVWRNLVGDEETGKVAKIESTPIPDALDRQLNRAIKKIGEDIVGLRFNTAIAELIKLNNEITGLDVVPQELAEDFVAMLSPFAPHIAEEIWERLGKKGSLARHEWPEYDEAKLVDTTMDLPVQVNGKLRDKITVAADADEATILQIAEKAEKVIPWIEGKTIKKKLYVPKKLVNIVVG